MWVGRNKTRSSSYLGRFLLALVFSLGLLLLQQLVEIVQVNTRRTSEMDQWDLSILHHVVEGLFGDAEILRASLLIRESSRIGFRLHSFLMFKVGELNWIVSHSLTRKKM